MKRRNPERLERPRMPAKEPVKEEERNLMVRREELKEMLGG